jgi:hypothetical protein
MGQVLAFNSAWLVLQCSLVLWDTSKYALLLPLSTGVFDSCEWLPEGHFKNMFGRWRYFTVWTMDINMIQSIDGMIAATRGTYPTPWLQFLALIMALSVSPGLVTMPPFDRYRESDWTDDFARLCAELSPNCHYLVFCFSNFWVHGGMALFQWLQASTFRNPAAPSLMSLVGRKSIALVFIVVASWITFSETVTKTWARYKTEIAWPYGERLTRLMYVGFPILCGAFMFLCRAAL